ncbi:MAG: carbohydrate ABC transporter permease [Treponemataceae bacterium]
MRNKGKLDWLVDAAIVMFMVSMIVLTLYPFYYIIMASISRPSELMSHRGLILAPLGGISWAAYKSVIFENPMIPIGYLNTIFYVAFGTVINITLTTLGAYALSRKKAKLVQPAMFAITFTMLFSGGMIPLFLLVKQLGLINSRLAILLPTAVSAYNLIIMRTSFQALPDSLEESAKMDGANDFIILWRIALPLSKAVVAVMVLFYSVSHWNSWFPAMMYLRDRDLYPLQLVLREILIMNNTESMTTGAAMSDAEPIGAAIQYATIMVSTLPILVVYPFLQKYFVKGVMIGAIKG